jgi:hypothetical protein
MVMKKLMMSAAGAASVLVSMAAVPTPVFAQAQTSGEIIVYGTDPCPRSTDDAIMICKRYPESMRYRIPDPLRESGTPQQRNSWANKSKVLTTVGDTGAQSCSAVGPGGHTGCLIQSIKEAKSQTRQQAEDNQPPQN